MMKMPPRELKDYEDMQTYNFVVNNLVGTNIPNNAPT